MSSSSASTTTKPLSISASEQSIADLTKIKKNLEIIEIKGQQLLSSPKIMQLTKLHFTGKALNINVVDKRFVELVECAKEASLRTLSITRTVTSALNIDKSKITSESKIKLFEQGQSHLKLYETLIVELDLIINPLREADRLKRSNTLMI